MKRRDTVVDSEGQPPWKGVAGRRRGVRWPYRDCSAGGRIRTSSWLPRLRSGAAPELATVAATALVTTAVVPFVQALVSKAAEDAYGQARSLVRRMLRQNGQPASTAEPAQPVGEPVGEPTDEEEPGLLIADDTEAGITLFMWSNASDEALRALSSLDMDELITRRPDQGRVRLVWHPTSGRWRIRGE
ncbi:hypothetical protein ABZX30_29980 [Streptomyces sp. NPDC004542]|uniref:hypothetical protein n=1 Tax=Streptomyces sp. NPDC004542 TaxID=3154281 RepID=UPI0033BDDD5E